MIRIIWKSIKDKLSSILTLDSCPVCGKEDDSLLHIFRDCVEVRMFWKTLQLSCKVSKQGGHRCKEWLWNICDRLSRKELLLFIAGLWVWWWEFNRVTHGGTRLPCNSLRNATSKLIPQQEKENAVAGNGFKPIDVKWLPPESHTMKLNVDTSFKPATLDSSAGFVLRDSTGQVVLLGAIPLGKCSSALLAEVTAIIESMLIIAQAGFNQILITSDSLNAIHLCKERNRNLNYLGLALEEVAEISRCFKEVSFVHERRLANGVAHCLAQWGENLSQVYVTADAFPSSVLPCIEHDMHFPSLI